MNWSRNFQRTESWQENNVRYAEKWEYDQNSRCKWVHEGNQDTNQDSAAWAENMVPLKERRVTKVPTEEVPISLLRILAAIRDFVTNIDDEVAPEEREVEWEEKGGDADKQAEVVEQSLEGSPEESSKEVRVRRALFRIGDVNKKICESA